MSAANFKQPFFAGVDVGGTNIKIGIVDNLGNIVGQTKFPTLSDRSPDLAIEQAQKELNKLTATAGINWGSDIAGVGLGTPGPMNIKQGLILTPTNLPGWHHFPIRDKLSEALGKPVSYANDAAAAAFGEFWVGGASAFESIVLFTLGTGVGGGIIIDDFSIDGSSSHGAELGHLTIETGENSRMCGCGQAGHLEAYASATAVVQRTIEALGELKSGEDSILRNQTEETSPLSALMVSNAAESGDPLAIRIVDETARFLASGIALMAHTIDPEAFILGGAMNFGGNESQVGRKFLSDVIRHTKEMVFPVLAENLVVKFAELGGEAGFVGAAGLAWAKHNRNK
ncbi:MAG: ROK family protein [Planctomycetota bacterium]